MKHDSSESARVALVHDWFATYAGSERVVEQILKLFPNADVFSVVDFLPSAERSFLGGRTVRTSFVQKLPGARRRFRAYLPLMPLAIEQFDLSSYDLVISSSHAVAKGVITGPDQVHVSYVHSPIRYAWDMQQEYLEGAGIARGVRGIFVRAMLHYLRIWDVRASVGVDHFLANSQFISRRIRKVYRRESEVVYPPVDVRRFRLNPDKEDFYLAASRMVSYKRLDLVVEAFSRMPGRRLVIIGDGPDRQKVERMAAENVQILGHQPFNVLRDYMERARAFVFAAKEDFGIMPVEAMACGTPVIAYGRGGAAETVVEGESGVLFGEQTASSIVDAVGRFEVLAGSLDPNGIRLRAEAFREEAFQSAFVRAMRRAGIEVDMDSEHRLSRDT